jgi:ubiquinone/menaquinone biosynthesis C-methylase UbiE
MGLYARYLIPRLTHFAMSRELLLPYRQRVIGGAVGRVLEIGIGSGLNLPLYGDTVEEVIGVDISPELLAMAENAAVLESQRRRLRVRLLEGSAEHLPSTIAEDSVDTVVVTWALCSIPDVEAALTEAHRVRRHGGSLRFVEHGRSPDTSMASKKYSRDGKCEAV